MTTIKYDNLLNFVNLYNSNITEIKNQYINLLKNLTVVEDITDTQFIKQINEIFKFGIIIIAFCENNDHFTIVGSGTVIIEPKIIRNCKSVAHIEDIVVDPNYRGAGIAKNIISLLKDFSITNNCYKIIHNCTNNYVPFYEKSGFIVKGNEMSIYL